MFSIEIECTPDQQDLLIAELSDENPAGISEIAPGRLRVFFEADRDRAALIERFHACGSREEEERDWVALSRANWEPVAVGRRFFLAPEWRDDPAPEGRFRIVVNPGMAFGTGIHETTRLCLEGLEEWIRPGEPMLDVGTGSGILAEAAALLGASTVWACDVDPIAVEIARAKAGRSVFIGSVDAVRTRSAGVICANISPEAILHLAGDLVRCLDFDGIVLASGFERHEAPAIESAFAYHGAKVRGADFKNSWALLAVGRVE